MLLALLCVCLEYVRQERHVALEICVVVVPQAFVPEPAPDSLRVLVILIRDAIPG